MRMQLRHIIQFVLIFPLMLSAQNNADTLMDQKEPDPATVNFIFSYYEQDGVHSPVTGGIGDEELHDYIGKISVNVPLNNKLSISASGGVDVYTSASTDNINDEHDLLLTETSASYIDARRYADAGFKLKRGGGRTIIGVNTGFSKEWDVGSFNGGIVLAHFSKDEK